METGKQLMAKADVTGVGNLASPHGLSQMRINPLQVKEIPFDFWTKGPPGMPRFGMNHQG
jgi:hypothetical protein